MSGVNKIIFGDQTLVDLTTDTVTEKSLMRGYSAHSADGSPIEGLYTPGEFNVEHKYINQNGTYNASSDNVDGYSSINVDVPKDGIFKEIDVEENGTYNASSYNADGFSIVGVDIEDHGDYTTTIDGTPQTRDLDFVSCYTEMPQSFALGSAVVYNNVLHIFGGSNRKAHYVYNAVTGTWSRLNDLPYDFYDGDAIVRSDFYYKPSEGDATRINILFIRIIDDDYHVDGYYWDNSNDVWYHSNSPSLMPIGNNTTLWCRAVVLGYEDQTYGREYGHIFCSKIITTTSSTSYAAGRSRFSTFSLNNVNLVDLGTPVKNGDVVVFNGKIHVIIAQGHGAHYVYNDYPASRYETDLSSLLPDSIFIGAVSITMVVYNNKIHVFTQAAHYTFDGSSWEQIELNPCDFRYATSVVYNNEIHILGADSNANYLGHYKWNPTDGWQPLGQHHYRLVN